MAKLTDEIINQYFSIFQEDYKCLVYGLVSHRHGFFSRNDMLPAFVALSDTEKLLVVELSRKKKTAIGYAFSRQNLRKLKIKKCRFFPIQKINSVFMHKGSEFKVVINFSRKIFTKCESLQNQEQNIINLIETLEKWGAEL